MLTLIFRHDGHKVVGVSTYLKAPHIEDGYKYLAIDIHTNNSDHNFNIINEKLMNRISWKSNLKGSVFLINDYRRRSRFYPTIPTCVGFAKYLLGIYNPFIITPEQLFNKIKSKYHFS